VQFQLEILQNVLCLVHKQNVEKDVEFLNGQDSLGVDRITTASQLINAVRLQVSGCSFVFLTHRLGQIGDVIVVEFNFEVLARYLSDCNQIVHMLHRTCATVP